ncbi:MULTISPECIES: hypothetical protein [Kaistia]|mgnify:CR=1 FL=1|uniref:Uncharacterized protein n=1 Tax=Kaistia nematophila TaxID=2994654 RepID=A0A9X3E1H0_9HYPH|nr:hypothetical protein [Kaistia nematophila]MBN9025490.1 hypothetical protein [Hyphomicrobiales bacterium]MBN9060262.1 hypothetical protein [Hyphomicrobiales bacterium]MCX5569667.1 hypothetical protein [Kaistia nematophila]
MPNTIHPKLAAEVEALAEAAPDEVGKATLLNIARTLAPIHSDDAAAPMAEPSKPQSSP